MQSACNQHAMSCHSATLNDNLGGQERAISVHGIAIWAARSVPSARVFSMHARTRRWLMSEVISMHSACMHARGDG